MKDIMFTASGRTSWGDTWEWMFDGGVELQAPDGRILLITDLHTQCPDYNFEDDLFDHDFSMSSAQDAEWGQICWNCYMLESMIYALTWESFTLCAGQIVQDFRAKNPDVTSLSDSDAEDMLAACLDAIKKQRGWNGEGLYWLFKHDGSISVAVDEWLTVLLAEQGLQVSY